MRFNLSGIDEQELGRRIAEHESRGARLVRRDSVVKGNKQFNTDEFSGRVTFESPNEYVRYIAGIDLTGCKR